MGRRIARDHMQNNMWHTSSSCVQVQRTKPRTQAIPPPPHSTHKQTSMQPTKREKNRTRTAQKPMKKPYNQNRETRNNQTAKRERHVQPTTFTTRTLGCEQHHIIHRIPNLRTRTALFQNETPNVRKTNVRIFRTKSERSENERPNLPQQIRTFGK